VLAYLKSRGSHIGSFVESLITMSIPITTSIIYLSFPFGSIEYYAALLTLSIVLANIQLYLSLRGVKLFNLWIIPIAIAIQSLLMKWSVDLALFLPLSLLMVLTIKNTSIEELMCLTLKRLIYLYPLTAVIALVLGIGPLPYIVLAPLWEYLFIGYGESSSVAIRISRAFTIPMIYSFNLYMALYAMIISILKVCISKPSKLLVPDTSSRLALLWALSYGV